MRADNSGSSNDDGTMISTPHNRIPPTTTADITVPPNQGHAKLNCLAKALYDNIAESPDELAFRKGDVLTVLEQNTGGLEGWWLCSLRGRQGIAPGNRLRLMPGMYDPTGLGYAGGTGNFMGIGNAGTYPGPGQRHARRRSWSTNQNKVVTPQKIGGVYLYDVPPGAKVPEEYDVPQSHTLPLRNQNHLISSQMTNYDTPPSPRAVRSQVAYDEPRSHIPPYDFPRPDAPAYDEPRSHAPLQDSNLPSSEMAKLQLHDYDIPNSDNVSTYDVPGPPRAVPASMTTYDIPPQQGPRTAIITIDSYHSNRSSGVSAMSSSSSPYLSPSGSQSSLNTSLSLSSLCGSNRSSLEQQPQELYDIPPSEPRRVTDPRLIGTAGSSPSKNIPNVPPVSVSLSCFGDVPSSRTDTSLFYDTPPIPRPAGIQAVEGVYDVPPQVTRDISPIPRSGSIDCLDGGKRFSSSSSDSRDSKENVPSIEGKELPLELDAAMEMLVKVHHEIQSAITKLFSFVSTTWRRKENMEKRIDDIRVACHRIRNSVRDFLEFAYGTLVNSTYAPDKTLSHKLAKLIKPLADSQAIVQSTTQSLDDKGWQLAKLVSEDDAGTPDELDQLVACARTLVEDVRQVSSFIQGNSTLLFKRSQLITEKPAVALKPTDLRANIQGGGISPTHNTDSLSKAIMQDRPLPPPPVQHIKLEEEIPSKDCLNDYDYVNLESKESVEREHEQIKATLPKELHKSFDNLVKQSQIPVDSDLQNFVVSTNTTTGVLDSNDRQLLQFYGNQMDSHIVYLTNAIDAFLMTIDKNQPPKVFIGHSKFVVIGAHKLVYIGDTVHRNIANQDIKYQTMQLCNKLCDSLKTLVNNTKKAALQFPSVMAVQEMVDSVVDVSHVANDLKVCIVQAARL